MRFAPVFRPPTLAALLVPLALLAGPGTARATCGSANCFLTSSTDPVLAAGRTTIDLSYRYIPQDRMHSGPDTTSEVIVPAIDFETRTIVPNHHREFRTVNMLGQLDVAHGVAPNVTVAVAVPFHNQRLHEHDDDVDLGSDPAGTFTNADGTTGMGDVSVSVRWAARVGMRHTFVVGAGVKAPTGEYRLRSSAGEVGEPTLMPGTGSWDFTATAMATYMLVPPSLNAFASFLERHNTPNPLAYALGDSRILTAGIAWTATPNWTALLQLNARVVERDTYRGTAVTHTGGNFLYVTPGVRQKLSPMTSIYAHLQLPLVQDVNETNLVPRYLMELGVAWLF
jgi:Putative MetA-pathway of phenol degradation